MNFIVENLKNPKTILMVLGLTGIIVSGVMIAGYGSYLRTTVGLGEEYTPIKEKSCDLKGIAYADFLHHTQPACDTYCAGYASAKVSQSGLREVVQGSNYRVLITNFSPCEQNEYGSDLSYPSYYKAKTITCECSGCKTKAVCDTGYDCKAGKCVKEVTPATCGADGKCKTSGCSTGDPDCTCNEQDNGHLCETGETCSGTSLNHKGFGTCCSVACTPAAPTTCNQTFEVMNENNKSISGSKIIVGGSSCNTNSNGNCSIKLKKDERHTARATKSGYECYNNRCSKTFTGCPPEWIPLFLKKSATPEICDGKDNDGDGLVDEGNLCRTGYKCQNGRCVKEAPTTCNQTFEAMNENNKAISGSKIIVGGSSCNTNSNGNCSIKLKKDERHTARATKSGYECYNNRCSKTFTGCPPEWIPLFLKKTVTLKPDLVVRDISWIPTNSKVGDNVKFKVSVKNVGNATAYYPPTKIKISSIGYEKVKTGLKINAGQTVIYDFSANPAKFSSSGNYTVAAIADYINNTAESNEKNNKRTETVKIASEPEPEPQCSADGKCKTSGCSTGDPDCTCNEQDNGHLCETGETCSGRSLRHKNFGTCCSVACTPAAIYSISGQVLKNNSGLSGIAINLTGDSSSSASTNNYGNYSFDSLTNGSYMIVPSNNNYIFAPISHTITIPEGCITTNMNNIDFNAVLKECNPGETRKYTCPDGTEVDWCACNENYKMVCIDFPENNCPATCRADGKCKTDCRYQSGDPDCLCSELDGHICQTGEMGEICSGTSLKHSGTGICCSVACQSSAPDFQTADLNCDNRVGPADMAILLGNWGQDPSGSASCQSPDINKDGIVSPADFAKMMGQWTTF